MGFGGDRLYWGDHTPRRESADAVECGSGGRWNCVDGTGERVRKSKASARRSLRSEVDAHRHLIQRGDRGGAENAVSEALQMMRLRAAPASKIFSSIFSSSSSSSLLLLLLLFIFFFQQSGPVFYYFNLGCFFVLVFRFEQEEAAVASDVVGIARDVYVRALNDSDWRRGVELGSGRDGDLHPFVPVAIEEVKAGSIPDRLFAAGGGDAPALIVLAHRSNVDFPTTRLFGDVREPAAIGR